MNTTLLNNHAKFRAKIFKPYRVITFLVLGLFLTAPCIVASVDGTLLDASNCLAFCVGLFLKPSRKRKHTQIVSQLLSAQCFVRFRVTLP